MSVSGQAIMQLEVIYYPTGYRRKELYDKITWESGGYYVIPENEGEKTSIDDCLTNEEPEQTVLRPFISWRSLYIAGESYTPEETSLLSYEFDMIGNDIFEGFEETIYEMTIEDFQKHPDLLPNKGLPYMWRKGKEIPLSEYKDTLIVNILLLWNCWIDYDEYSGEEDSESFIVGRINPNLLENALRKKENEDF